MSATLNKSTALDFSFKTRFFICSKGSQVNLEEKNNTWPELTQLTERVAGNDGAARHFTSLLVV